MNGRRARRARQLHPIEQGRIPVQRGPESQPAPAEQEHIFAGDWFKCAECEGEAHVDSTPLPGDLCSACAALLDKEAS
jgi:hypothetical protein